MDHHRNLSLHMSRLSKARVPLPKAMGGERPLAWAMGARHLLCQLWVDRHLLYGQRQQGAKCNMAPLVRFIGDGDKPQQSSQKPGAGGHGPQLPEVCNQAPPADPVTSVVSKKEGTGTEYHTLLLSLTWEHTCPAAVSTKY